MHATNEPGKTSPDRLRALLRRVGFAGFLFFLVKGLLWLLVPIAIAALLK